LILFHLILFFSNFFQVVFGSIGSLEGHQKIKNGKLLDIGEQQGVDW